MFSFLQIAHTAAQLHRHQQQQRRWRLDMLLPQKCLRKVLHKITNEKNPVANKIFLYLKKKWQWNCKNNRLVVEAKEYRSKQSHFTCSGTNTSPLLCSASLFLSSQKLSLGKHCPTLGRYRYNGLSVHTTSTFVNDRSTMKMKSSSSSKQQHISITTRVSLNSHLKYGIFRFGAEKREFSNHAFTCSIFPKNVDLP